MNSRRMAWPWMLGLAAMTAANVGCLTEDAAEELAEIAEDILDEIDEIQILDPRNVDLPEFLVNRGDTVIIREEVTIINVIQQDLVVEELPDVTLLGFENLTGLDVYLTYSVEDEFQGVLVFDGETLLLEYDCLADFELIGEDDIDPETGVLVDAFDFTDALFLNPQDFICGEAVIVTLFSDGVDVTTERIDLTR